MQALTEMQARFVLAYTASMETFGNGTRSAMAAGYSPLTARVQAQQLLALQHVQEAIAVIETRQIQFVLRALGRAANPSALPHRVRLRAAQASMALLHLGPVV
jgi:transcription initiation factor TFIIIB Brf1 subunit/transcription initiation factor TFIIB